VPSARAAAAAAIAPDPAPAAGAPNAGAGPSAPECYLGVVLASRTVEVVAEVAGSVVRVDVRPGDAVAAGEPLAAIDADATRHQLAVERAGLAAAELGRERFGLEVHQAEQELARARALENLVARQELERAALRVETAKASHEIARAEVARAAARVAALEGQLARSEIRAPFAGTVALRHLDPGAVVAPGAPVVRLHGGGAPFVRFAVPPERAADLAAGAAVEVELAGRPGALRAAVRQVSPEVDAATGMVFAEADLETAPDVAAGYAPHAAARVSLARGGLPPGCSETAPAAAARAAGRALPPPRTSG
jgi:RND family efflux transporter MFP subunit